MAQGGGDRNYYIRDFTVLYVRNINVLDNNMNKVPMIDFSKSGLNKWSIIVLYVLLVLLVLYKGVKDYNAPYNAHLQCGEFLAYEGGDTHGYIDAIEIYIQTGKYNEGSMENKNIGRGPYYGLYYYVFRQFLPAAKAFDAVAVLQI